jgi:hypothetical protein
MTLCLPFRRLIRPPEKREKIKFMREKRDIEDELCKLNQMEMSNEAIRANFKVDILAEILLDIRELLAAKSKSRRVLVEEVPLNEREQELLNNLQDHE